MALILMEGGANSMEEESVRRQTGDEDVSQLQRGGEGEGEGEEDEMKKKEGEELIEKAQRLMDKITSSSPDNPNPTVLHALSSLLETQESLYVPRSFLSPPLSLFISNNLIVYLVM